MAYGVRWQINFVSRKNDKYRLEILQDGWDDTVVHLRGASSPFVTEEDNSDDIFKPIRPQTGSLRIADNGYDLEGNEFDYMDLVPENIFDNQVRLWLEGTGTIPDTLRFIGYIRAESLTSKIFEAVSIREFQVSCPLGMLYEIPLQFNNTASDMGTVKTIGQILYTALNSLHVGWEYVYKQNNVSHREDLISQVSLINFINDNNPSNNSYTGLDSYNAVWEEDGTTLGNVVEEICKFWGWALYTRGLNIYIVTRQQNFPFAYFAFSDLTSKSNVSLTEESVHYVDIDELSFASTDHTDAKRPGYRNITIEADVNEEDSVISPDFRKLTLDYYEGSPGQIIHQANDYQFVVRNLNTTPQGSTRKQFLENYLIYENRLLQPGGDPVGYVVAVYDAWKNDDFATKTSFGFKNGVCCYTGGQAGARTFVMQTQNDVCVPFNSAICIFATVERDVNPSTDGSVGGRTIEAALKIGNLYWTGSTWSSSPARFNIYTWDDSSITNPYNQFQGFTPVGILFDNHAGSQGHCIYVEYINPDTSIQQGLCGRMTLSLYATSGSPTQKDINCVLNGISISIVTPDSKLNPINQGSQKYTILASQNFHENLSVNLKMASGTTNKYGYGQLYDQNFKLLSTIPFRVDNTTTESKAPEVRLLQSMKKAYQSVTRQNTIEVFDNIQACLPNSVYDNHWELDSYFRLLCCSHDWREGKMKLTIIDK